jgi:hypothetical protein
MTSPFEVHSQVVEDEGLRVFGGYVEPGDAEWDALLSTVRDLMLDRLLRARSQRVRIALAVEAAVHGLAVEDDDGGLCDDRR